jgi:acyl-CoA dehydrogenase
MTTDSEQRIRLTEGIYVPESREEHFALLEETFRTVKRAEVVDRKVRAAVKAKTLPKAKGKALYDSALAASVITSDEHALLARAEELRNEAIQVDDFSQEEYLTHGAAPPEGSKQEVA